MSADPAASTIDPENRLRPEQWHRLTVERWGWSIRVLLDGHELIQRHDLEPTAGNPGLFVAKGTAFFDDVRFEEIPWQAENGREYNIPWSVQDDSEWYRPPELHDPSLDIYAESPSVITYRTDESRPETTTNDLQLAAASPEAALRRIAFRTPLSNRDFHTIGPYQFQDSRIPDPSDYHDYTEDEREEIRESDEADKLRRKTQYVPLVGKNSEKSLWIIEDGRWKDRGGLACVIASSWISLIAPESDGMLWNKHQWGPDVHVAFNLEENSEWFGWDQKPTHRHHPHDNIRLALSMERDSDSGYLVELNSDDRSHMIVYRKGEEVKRIRQDDDFPIQYTGGHSPYSPRKSRIALNYRDGTLQLTVNGQSVLDYTDPDPLDFGREGPLIGIGGYETRANFSHIEIRKPQ
ncbi:MAG: hypothetical protein ACOCTQ_02345 [Planctomycetota bacterium]